MTIVAMAELSACAVSVRYGEINKKELSKWSGRDFAHSCKPLL